MRKLNRYGLSALLIAFLFAVPLASAQDAADEIANTPGSEISFYGHIFGWGRDLPMPMNTQFPAGEGDYSLGTTSGCGAAPPLPDDSADCENWFRNEQFFYTTAGFVQTKTWEEWGEDYSQFHNERGQTKDIYFDTAMTPRSTYWMSADFHAWTTLLCDAMCWNWDPGMFQDWVVESWIWHANLGEWASSPSDKPDVTTIGARTAEGQTLIANGKTEPFDMVSIDPTIPTGQQTVWPFDIEYEWGEGFDGRVPYQNDLIIEFEWYQETDGQKYIIGDNVGAVFPNWNVNAGEDYPPTMVLPVRNPLDVELVFPRFVHDKLVILTVINTPWGSYDIDPEQVGIEIKDSQGNVVPMDGAKFTMDSSVAHSGHYKPINATWVWDYQKQGLEPGDYTITVGATNFQHSYDTETTATFSITKEGTGGKTGTGRSGLQSFTEDQLGDFQRGAQDQLGDVPVDTDGRSDQEQDDDKGVPGLALPLVVGAVAALAVALRRRRA